MGNEKKYRLIQSMFVIYKVVIVMIVIEVIVRKS